MLCSLSRRELHRDKVKRLVYATHQTTAGQATRMLLAPLLIVNTLRKKSFEELIPNDLPRDVAGIYVIEKSVRCDKGIGQ